MDAITANGITFTPDFRIASYAGEVLEFSKQQAAVVRVIVEAHQQGLPAISGNLILDAIFKDGHYATRIDEVFRTHGRRHPAWQKLIVRTGRNSYRIGNFPGSQTGHISATVLQSDCK